MFIRSGVGEPQSIHFLNHRNARSSIDLIAVAQIQDQRFGIGRSDRSQYFSKILNGYRLPGPGQFQFFEHLRVFLNGLGEVVVAGQVGVVGFQLWG